MSYLGFLQVLRPSQAYYFIETNMQPPDFRGSNSLLLYTFITYLLNVLGKKISRLLYTIS